MEIQINDETRVRVTSEYYAPLKKHLDKREKLGYIWMEYMWFTDIPSLVKYLTQKTLSEEDITVSLKDFLGIYKELRREIQEILSENGVR